MVLSLPRSTSLPLALVVPAFGLLVAYLYAFSHRPDIPDYLTVSNPSEHGFPRWYGNSVSPYDATAVHKHEADLDTPNDVLLVIDLPYDSPNIPLALSVERALRARPQTSVRVITSFSSSEDGALGLAHNLRDTPCGDWVWRIGEAASFAHGCEQSIWISEILGTGRSVDEGGLRHDSRADIELLRRPQALFEQESTHASLKAKFGEKWELGLMSHILPFADPSIYYPKIYKRTRSITYFPSPFTPRTEYPTMPWTGGWSMFRQTTSKPRIPAGKDPLAFDSRYRSFWRKEEARRAHVLRSSGICIFEDWADGQLTVEMAQAMLSGCVVAMTAPQTHHDILHPLVLTLPKPEKANGPVPAAALAEALRRTSDAELQLKALRAFIVARQMLTPVNRVKTLEKLVGSWKEGGRGYNLPHAFSWNCDSEPRPPWC